MIPVLPPAEVEVDENRRYISVNDAACELLGYSREEFLKLKIEDLSYPSGAHVKPMYSQYLEDGSMKGIFALRRKSGEIIWVRFNARITNGHSRSVFTHYEVWDSQRPGPGLNDDV